MRFLRWLWLRLICYHYFSFILYRVFYCILLWITSVKAYNLKFMRLVMAFYNAGNSHWLAR